MPALASTSNTLPRADIKALLIEHPMLWAPVYPQVFTPFAVDADKGVYPYLKLQEYTTPVDTRRTKDGAYNKNQTLVSEDSYQTVEDGLEERIDNRFALNYSSVVEWEARVADVVRHKVMLKRESDAISLLFNETTFPASGTTGVTAGAAWSTSSTDIIGDVTTARKNVFGKTGLMPNKMIVSAQTWMDMWRNTGIRSAIQYTMDVRIPNINDLAARAALAQRVGLQDIIIGNTPLNSANEGQTASNSNAWSGSTKYAFVYYDAFDSQAAMGVVDGIGDARPDPMAPSFARMYCNCTTWGHLYPETYDSPERDGRVVRVKGEIQLKIVNSALGNLIKSV